MKNIIIIAAVAVVLLAAMGGGFYIILDKISSIEKNATAEDTEDEVDNGNPKPLYPLATLIVNLADEDGRRYLRTAMDVELAKTGDEIKVEKRMAQIKDRAISIMSTRTFSDINSVPGKRKLKADIVAGLNEILKEKIVTNIYFTEFVIQ